MKLKLHTHQLQLAHKWKIAGGTGSRMNEVVVVELTDSDGVVGLGEAAPAATYKETPAIVLEFYKRLDVTGFSFDDIPGSMARLETFAPVPSACRCGINTALVDGAAKRAGKAIYDYFNLGFRENKHVTSFTIGLDTPEIVREKVLAAAHYPVLKLKTGDVRDRENLAAVRSAAPTKPVRADANEGWKTKEHALEMLEWLAADGHIQFVEQALPRTASREDFLWLKERSPLPLFADESCHTIDDVPFCAECFHGVNVKLVKTGGLSMAYETLQAARKAGLKTMIGCMIETSVLISAATHLAELTDHLDVDGNILITNDPYLGATSKNGLLSFAHAPEPTGLRVRLR
ncbi:MAG TPA: dipeptide epimerase [Verrucomicrobiae bacterium]|jgi:L-alanine-DL-glutamate epimerase-like enolase superfamily enzyme|nr:dipeptide epimerase [Verrucomicrobiae bacterium]